ncbi:MAG: ribonuclease Y [bacterium]|nr:ribonuclease Y [bacterium]
MLNQGIMIGTIVGGLLLGGLFGFFVFRKMFEKKNKTEEGRLKLLAEEAQRKAEALKKEAELAAKDYLYKAKVEFEKESREERKELQETEKRVTARQSEMDRNYEALRVQERELREHEKLTHKKEKDVEDLGNKYKESLNEVQATLEKVSGLSAEQARQQLVDKMTEEAKHEAAKKIKLIEDEAKESADRKAKRVISIAIERLAGEWVQERSVSVVNLPSDDMKGRIIGREGRNIRSLEALTGVDFVIDDTPGAVVLSSHNPVRREVARVTLENLLQDGRIHPARIEELVQKNRKDVEQSIKEAGQKALFELEIHGVHPEIMKLLGALKYRYSYAQNVLQHSVEVGFLSGMMAGELGLNVNVARRAGVLHDIGKAISHEVPGSHAVIGGQFAKKYGERDEVWHAIWAHHEDLPQDSILDNLVDAADALSGARPGARMEQTESYIKRLEDLEKIAMSFGAVHKAYGIQAGRELRVLVDPDKMSDEEASMVCKEIAKKIETDLTYPGQIRVTVIREKRAVDYAR